MAKVPLTSGQGVSRKAYQTGYKLGARGTGAIGKNALRTETPDIGKSTREYAKRDKPPKDHPFTVSYGDTLPITDLADLKGYLK